MKHSTLIGLLLLLSACQQAESAPPTEAQILAHAKDVDVHRLDASLASKRLEDWLHSGGNVGNVAWSSSNCCDCDRIDDRICTKFSIDQHGVIARGMLQLGTRSDGLSLTPRLLTLQVPPHSRDARLADLPRLLAKQRQMLTYAKTLDVKQLDARLPSQTLDDWMRNGPAHFDRMTWRLSGCDLKGDPALPLCARFTFQRGKVSGFGSVKIGTSGNGIAGTPRFLSALVSTGTGTDMQGEIVDHLADLATVVDKYLDAERPSESMNKQ